MRRPLAAATVALLVTGALAAFAVPAQAASIPITIDLVSGSITLPRSPPTTSTRRSSSAAPRQAFT